MHGFVSYRRFGKVRSLRSDRAWLVRGPMAILELVRGQFGLCLLPPDNRSVVCGLLVLLRVKCDKIGAAPCEGCLRTLVEGIKPFVVRPGVEILKTFFPQRDKFWDLVPGSLILCLEMLETSVLGLGQDLGLITALGGAMTTSAYVSRIVFDLIPSRFKVRDMFSAYVLVCAITLVSGVRELSLRDEGAFIEEGNFVEKWFFRRLRRLAMLKIDFSFVCRVSCWNVRGLEDVSRYCKGLVLTLCQRNIFGLSVDVRRQNCNCCSDANCLICD
uniref:Uncharacterized protein n=1 Tax=Brassica oleracea var. oleracea TaxID=109376 RepID=A0A0D3CR94_BRAOL